GNSPRRASLASLSASSRSLLRLTLRHRHRSSPCVCTTTAVTPAIAEPTSYTHPATSHVSTTSSTPPFAAAWLVSSSVTVAGVVWSVSKRCSPVAASITQQTLLNLPRSSPRIVAYPMQSSCGKEPPPIFKDRRRDSMGSLERNAAAVYF